MDSDTPTTPGAPVAPAVRRLLWTAATLVFLAGIPLYVFPQHTDRWFAWTIGSPLTATFLGASYWSAIGLEAAGTRARDWTDTRIAVPAVMVFTVTTLAVTVGHRDLFHFASDHSTSARVVAWWWLAVYGTVPVLIVAAVVVQRRASTSVRPPTGLPPLVGAVLVLQALVLLTVGVAMLVAPTRADAVWAWDLTPLTGRAVSTWLLGLGTASAHALMVDDRFALRPLAFTGLVFGVLQVITLLRYGDEMAGGARSVAYLSALLVISAVSSWVLWPKVNRSWARIR